MDEIIAALLRRNEQYAVGYRPDRAVNPNLGLAILCCMDHRVTTTLRESLGLTSDDADIVSNAGGLPTPDAIRSLVVSQRLKGTERIMVIGHTLCGMTAMDEAALRAEITRETGLTAPEFLSFRDAREAVVDTVAKLRTDPFLPHRDKIEGFVLNLESGKLIAVTPTIGVDRQDRSLR